MLKIESLAVSFGNRTILRGLGLEIADGEALALLGANGSGKTTLIGALAGTVRPDSGVFSLDGERFDPSLPSSKASVGCVPDTNALVPGLTFGEHFGFCGALHGLDAKESERRGAELLALFGLADAASEIVDYGSQGMQKRLACALSLLGRPRLLLLDEPFNGLDAANIFLLVDVLRECGRRGLMILFSTHGRETAALAADSFAELADGRIAARGAPADFREPSGGTRSRLPEAFGWIGS